VNISDAARSLSNQSTAAEGREASELRDFLSKFDFRSITPRQLAQVGGALFERGEISEDAASAFVGVETNLVESLNPDKPIDVVQHFQHMLSVAAAANEKEPGYFDFAVKFRQEASKALDDTISFVSDGRSHITPTE
jgi:hypothetical protein